VDETPQGEVFIAMAYYPGDTLRSRIERGPFPIEDAVATLEQIANGLAAAHAAGIVHRDLKPANVIVTPSGQVKILDFGLAKVVAASAETTTEVTEAGATLGTAAYMSPEQARGEHVDQRTDVWAFGVLAYELIAGRRPFVGQTTTAVLSSLLTDQPPRLRSVRPETPAEIESLVERTLVKNVGDRTVTMADASTILARYRAKVRQRESSKVRMLLGRPATAIPLVFSAVAILAAATWWGNGVLQRRWARAAKPEISRLADRQEFIAAVDLASQAERYLPGDPDLARLWPMISRQMTIGSEPGEAEVSYAAYDQPESWHRLGRTPLKDVHVPLGLLRMKAEKTGFQTAEDAVLPQLMAAPFFRIADPGKSPPGMVRASAPANSFSIYIFGLEKYRPFVRPAPGFIGEPLGASGSRLRFPSSSRCRAVLKRPWL
jgi:hypothetical protein